jgi:hypothetical protein
MEVTMNLDKSTDWRELYKEALFEADPEILLARIVEAHYAMQRRARELWYEGSSVTREQCDMDIACEFLEILGVMAADSGNEHAHRLVSNQFFRKEDS